MAERELTIISLSLGWGVQSWVLAAMSALGELPKVDFAIHSDTTWERSSTYEFARQWTDWVRGVLFPALNHRYNHNLATIITLNYSPDDKDPKAQGRSMWELYLGTAALDRVMGDSFDMIHFGGASFRSGMKW